MHTFNKAKARARLLIFILAGFIVPGGTPYGLIDH